MTVVRDGRRIEIDAAELVVGDLVAIEPGDRVSADLVAETAHGLLIDESILTGESVPVSIEVGGALRAGTFVAEGEGSATVVAIGSGTSLGRVAELTRTVDRPPTPLARELHRLVRMIAVIAVAVGVGFFGLMLLLGTSATEGFVFAVGVTVALVPEALLPTVTLALAVGAQRMAERNALVRRLESVETLGSTTFICTDKTGTLTENRMNVVEVWTPAGVVTIDGRGYEPTGDVTGDVATRPTRCDGWPSSRRRCSNGHAVERDGVWEPHGDPMEAAIDALVNRIGGDAVADAAADPDLARFPFDPRRRRMSVVDGTLGDGEGRARLGGHPVLHGRPGRAGAVDAMSPQRAAPAGGREPARRRRSADRRRHGRARPDAARGVRDHGPAPPDARGAIAACRAAGHPGRR